MNQNPTEPAGSVETLAEVPEHILKGLPEEVRLLPSAVDKTRLGVWATKPIFRGRKFGPFVGDKKKRSQVKSNVYMWEVYYPSLGWMCVDATDPEKGNWLRYVNWARSGKEQNLFPLEINRTIYYKTLKGIEAGEELLVWSPHGEQESPAVAAALQEERRENTVAQRRRRRRRRRRQQQQQQQQQQHRRRRPPEAPLQKDAPDADHHRDPRGGGKKKSQEAKNKGNKTIEKKPNDSLDLAPADMRESREGHKQKDEMPSVSAVLSLEQTAVIQEMVNQDMFPDLVISTSDVEPNITPEDNSGLRTGASDGLEEQQQEEEEEEEEGSEGGEDQEADIRKEEEEEEELEEEEEEEEEGGRRRCLAERNSRCETRCHVSPKKKPSVRFPKARGTSNGSIQGTFMFPCQHCERKFTTKQGLERHMHIHLSAVSHAFKCRYCGKAFGTQINRRRHERRHEAGPKRRPFLLLPSAQPPGGGGPKNQSPAREGAPEEASARPGAAPTPATAVDPEKKVLRETRNPPPAEESKEPKETHPCKYCRKVFGTHTNMRRHQRRVHERHLIPRGVKRKPEEPHLPTEQTLPAPNAYGASTDPEEEGETDDVYIMDVSSNISENLNYYIDGKIQSNSTTSNCDVIEVESSSTELYGINCLLKQLLQTQDGSKGTPSPPPPSSDMPKLGHPAASSPLLPTSSSRFKRRTSSPPSSPQHSPALRDFGRAGEGKAPWNEAVLVSKIPKLESHSSSPAWSLSGREEKETASPLCLEEYKVPKDWVPGPPFGNVCNQQPLDLSSSMKQRAGIKNRAQVHWESVLDLSLHKKPCGDGEAKEGGPLPASAGGSVKKKPTTSMLQKVLLNEYNGTVLSLGDQLESSVPIMSFKQEETDHRHPKAQEDPHVSNETELIQESFNKNFVCNVCESPFLSIKDLTKHLTAHAEEWPFKCEFCVQLFRQKTDLSEHRFLLHGVGTIFVCSLCKKEFAFLCNLQQHQRDLHPDQECTHHEFESGTLRPQNFTDPTKARPEHMQGLPEGSLEVSKEEEEDELNDSSEELYTTIKIMASGVKSKNPDVRMGLNQHYPSFKPPPFQYHHRNPNGIGITATNFTTHNIPQTFTTAIRCTKCGKSVDNMPELHKHILACASASDKKRYTPKKNPVPLKQTIRPKNGVVLPAAASGAFRRTGQPKRLSFSVEAGRMSSNKLKISALKKKNQLVQKAILQKKKSQQKAELRNSSAEPSSHICPYCNREFTYIGSLNKHASYSCPKKPISPSSKKKMKKKSGTPSSSNEKKSNQRRRTADAEIKMQSTQAQLGKTRARSSGPTPVPPPSTSFKVKPSLKFVPSAKSKKPSPPPSATRNASPARVTKTVPADGKKPKGLAKSGSSELSGKASCKLHVRIQKAKGASASKSAGVSKKADRFNVKTPRERVGGPVTRSLQQATSTDPAEKRDETSPRPEAKDFRNLL
ncbi:hypothetical protein JRQ81_009894 [Phrynocephalus forsythii]|uniref:PR domain zinc finger protein 2 n=1 Tax=Phrynocephalus forsythii TaxID=171643 RepID=A0A9Q1ARW3_9SAUR|nr:hypothetical protein JRQ81_009894 [Phrynocephalus forsythii]